MSNQLLVFVIRRLIALIVTVALASLVIFTAIALAPGDPAALIAGSNEAKPETLQAIRDQFHLSDPIWMRYLYWVHDLFTGHLGTSFVYGTDVEDIIGPRIATTLLLVAYAALIIIVIGVVSGAIAALRGGKVDRTVTIVSSVMMGMPTFVVAILLIFIFTRGVDWLPVFGSGHGFADRIQHLTLPAVALGFAYIAYVSRMTRTAVRKQMGAEHVVTAVSRGLPRWVIIRRHVLHNASSGIFSVSGLTIASLFAGAAVAEKAFGVAGLGSLLVDAAARRDLPLVQVVSMLMVVIFVVVNSVVDMIDAVLDPRTAGLVKN